MAAGQRKHLSVGDGVKLNTAGAGSVLLAPNGEDWVVMITRVSTTGTTPEPTVTTYRGSVSPSSAIEGTYSGFSDTSDTRYLIASGESLVVDWVGGPANARASVRVEGIATPPGEGAALLGGG